jgi:hypothetical protein
MHAAVSLCAFQSPFDISPYLSSPCPIPLTQVTPSRILLLPLHSLRSAESAALEESTEEGQHSQKRDNGSKLSPRGTLRRTPSELSGLLANIALQGTKLETPVGSSSDGPLSDGYPQPERHLGGPAATATEAAWPKRKDLDSGRLLREYWLPLGQDAAGGWRGCEGATSDGATL